MMTLDRLKYFIEAAELEHVGQAAKKLHISASVVSSAILALEEEFHGPFFIREKNRLKLNEKGMEFLFKAKKVIDQANELYVNSPNENLQGHFKMGGSHFLLNQYLVPAFIKLQKKHPEITADFISMDTGSAVARTMLGDLDLGIVFRSQFNHELNEVILAEGHFVIAVKKGHKILKAGPKDRIHELNQLPAITFKTSTGPQFPENHPALRTSGIIPDHQYFYSDDQTALMLLQQTNGWALLPDTIVEKYRAKLEKVVVSAKWSAPVFVSLIHIKKPRILKLESQIKEILLRAF